MDILTFHSLFYVTKNLGRISGNNRVRGNVFSDYAASTYNCVLADARIGENCCSGADGRPLLDHRAFNLPVGFGLQISVGGRCTRITIVDEHHSMPNEDVVLYEDAFADKGVAGNLAALAYTGIFLDFHECADLCLIADLATV